MKVVVLWKTCYTNPSLPLTGHWSRCLSASKLKLQPCIQATVLGWERLPLPLVTTFSFSFFPLSRARTFVCCRLIWSLIYLLVHSFSFSLCLVFPLSFELAIFYLILSLSLSFDLFFLSMNRTRGSTLPHTVFRLVRSGLRVPHKKFSSLVIVVVLVVVVETIVCFPKYSERFRH